MATVSALRSRLAQRLGLTTLTNAESNRLAEALYSAYARVMSERTPGYAFSNLTGETYGETAITISAHTANTSVMTLASLPTGTAVGDVLELGDNSYMIYSVSGVILDVGAPVKASEATNTGTIYHRNIELPHAGSVMVVVDTTNNQELEPMNSALARYGFDRAQPLGYEQHYDRANNKTYLQLWPVPDAATQVSIEQAFVTDLMTVDTDIQGTEQFHDAVMAKAMTIWRLWQLGGVSPTELAAAEFEVKDSSAALRRGAAASGGIRRSGFRARGLTS